VIYSKTWYFAEVFGVDTVLGEVEVHFLEPPASSRITQYKRSGPRDRCSVVFDNVLGTINFVAAGKTSRTKNAYVISATDINILQAAFDRVVPTLL
jgi:hypothetical protein